MGEHGWFSVVPDFATADGDLSDAAYRTLGAILRASYREGRCDLGNGEIGAMMGGRSVSRVSGALRELEDRGYIRCHFRDESRRSRSHIEILFDVQRRGPAAPPALPETANPPAPAGPAALPETANRFAGNGKPALPETANRFAGNGKPSHAREEERARRESRKTPEEQDCCAARPAGASGTTTTIADRIAAEAQARVLEATRPTHGPDGDFALVESIPAMVGRWLAVYPRPDLVAGAIEYAIGRGAFTSRRFGPCVEGRLRGKAADEAAAPPPPAVSPVPPAGPAAQAGPRAARPTGVPERDDTPEVRAEKARVALEKYRKHLATEAQR